MMIKSNTLSALTLALVLALATISCNKSDQQSHNQATATTVGDSTIARLPIAYVDLDSLLANYKYANQVQDELMREMESRQATFNQKQRNFESEAREFQRKVENNAFFDQGRAQREQERIMKLQQQLQELSQKLQVELMQLEADKMQALSDTIMAHVQQYNDEVGKYQMILSNKAHDNILCADKSYDITTQVTKYLNDRYTPAKKEETTEKK